MGKKFRAHIGGSSIARGPEAEFDKLSEARRWVSEYGTTADWCNVYRGDRLVVRYYRSAATNKWYKAEICQN